MEKLLWGYLRKNKFLAFLLPLFFIASLARISAADQDLIEPTCEDLRGEGGRNFCINGTFLDDRAVSELITVITSTSPIPSIPSAKYLYEAQKSLFQIPGLACAKKIIVFDGVPSHQKRFLKKYEQYKQNIIKLVGIDSYFANTQLVFLPFWGHLSGAMREAIRHVKTPFVFVHQHDLILLKEFDLTGLVASMIANPQIKYVYFARRPIAADDFYHGPVSQQPEGFAFVPLCKSWGWSDQCHIASVDYYISFVLPQCQHGFMEDFLHPKLKNGFFNLGDAAHAPFGTYLYGNLFDGPYILHLDARGG